MEPHSSNANREKSNYWMPGSHNKTVNSKTASSSESFQKEKISCKKRCVSFSVFVNTFITLVNRDEIM